jgi:hypothetical protein
VLFHFTPEPKQDEQTVVVQAYEPAKNSNRVIFNLNASIVDIDRAGMDNWLDSESMGGDHSEYVNQAFMAYPDSFLYLFNMRQLILLHKIQITGTI